MQSLIYIVFLSFEVEVCFEISNMNNSVKYTSRSYRAVYDPNAQGGPQLMEYESSSRGIRGSDCESISETRRRYTDSTGNERIGLARTVRQF